MSLTFNIFSAKAEGTIDNINIVSTPVLVTTDEDKAFALHYEAQRFSRAGAQVKFIDDDQFVIIDNSDRVEKIIYAESAE